MANAEHWIGLAAALMIGLVIGLERGWQQRAVADGGRVAGLRTFALIGLLGGVVGLIGSSVTAPVIAVGFAGLAVLLALGYWRFGRQRQALGITTEVAALLTFLFGALASLGEPLLATAGAVVSAVLLGFKPRLHSLLEQIDAPELRAVLQLALISAVILPLVPNSGYGPWEVLNPRQIWLMVVLISAIGFVGHFAVRVVGARRGVLLTGLFAGLASSTALTLMLSRAARQQPAFAPIFAAAVVLASTTMFPRVLVLVGAVSPSLLPPLLLPIGVITASGVIASGLLALLANRGNGDLKQPPMQKPFALLTALRFALLLAVVMVAAEGLRRYAGDVGVYTVAFISGLTDVDAITLSIVQMHPDELSARVAERGILIAALANTTVKMGLAIGIGRGRMSAWVSAGLGAVIITGLGWMAVSWGLESGL